MNYNTGCVDSNGNGECDEIDWMPVDGSGVGGKYAGYVDREYLRGLNEEVRVYDSSGDLIIGTVNNYITESQGDEVRLLDISQNFPKAAWISLGKTETTEYFDVGSISSYVEYTYNKINGQIEKSAIENTDGTSLITKTTYAYDSIPAMEASHMLSQVRDVEVLEDDVKRKSHAYSFWELFESQRGDDVYHIEETRTCKTDDADDCDIDGTPSHTVQGFIHEYDDYGRAIELEDSLGTISRIYFGKDADPCVQDSSASPQYKNAYVTCTETVGRDVISSGCQDDLECAAGERCVRRFVGGGQADGECREVLFTTTYTYDDKGNILTVTDEDNAVTTSFTYDSLGRLKSVTGPTGLKSEYDYCYANQEEGCTNPGRNYIDVFTYTDEGEFIESRSRYDGLGRVYRTRIIGSPNIFPSYIEYSDRGLVEKVYDPHYWGEEDDYAKTEYENSPLVRVEKVYPNYKDLDTVYIESEYSTADWNGKDYKITRVTDENGNKAVSYTDKFGNLVKSVTAEGTDEETIIDSYEYDILGNLLSVTSPNGLTTTSTYDILGRVIETVSDEEGISKVMYDDNSNIIIADKNGNIAHFYYDELDRLLCVDSYAEESFIDGTDNREYKDNLPGCLADDTMEVRNYYDDYSGCYSDVIPEDTSYPVGRLTCVEDTSGWTGFRYDAEGRVAEKIWGANDYTSVVKIKYVYYDNNVVKSVTVDIPGSEYVTEYGLDDYGRMSTVTANGEVVSYGYTVKSLIDYINFANDVATDYSYDARDRVSDIIIDGFNEDETFDLDYDYDNVGNVMQISGDTATTSDVEVNYAYDSLYRLTDVTDAITNFHGTIGYEYDEVGNRLSRTGGVGFEDVDYNYGAGNDKNKLISSSDGYSYDYDDNGNMIKKVDSDGLTYSYLFDSSNRLLSYAGGADNLMFEYDYQGRRVAKTNYGVNFVHNPSFEMDELDLKDGNLEPIGWTYNEGVGSVGFVDDAYYGSKAVELSSSGGKLMVGTDGLMDLIDGVEYTASVWAKSKQGGVEAKIWFGDPYGYSIYGEYKWKVNEVVTLEEADKWYKLEVSAIAERNDWDGAGDDTQGRIYIYAEDGAEVIYDGVKVKMGNLETGDQDFFKESKTSYIYGVGADVLMEVLPESASDCGSNVVLNPGFEEEEEDWDFSNYVSVVDSSECLSGSCVKWDLPEDGGWNEAKQFVYVEPNKEYNVGGWFKIKDAGEVIFKVEEYDASEQRIEDWAVRLSTESDEWEKLSASFETSPDVAYVKIYGIVYSEYSNSDEGTQYMDSVSLDCSVKTVIPEKVEMEEELGIAIPGQEPEEESKGKRWRGIRIIGDAVAELFDFGD